MYASYYVIIMFSVVVTAAQEFDNNYLTSTFNHRVYHDQYLKEITPPKPTKQGPVLFPNDAPPPPRPPLIVTSRPLTESIAKSDLNQTEGGTRKSEDQILDNVTQNPIYNAVAEPSVNLVQFRRNYLSKPYDSYDFVTPRPFPTPRPRVTPTVFVDAVTGRPLGYGDYYGDGDYRPDDRTVLGNYLSYDKPTPLPPIYRVLSHHANQNLARIQEKNARERQKQMDLYEDYKPRSRHQHTSPYEQNRVDGQENENDLNSNYAFSYTVRDQKTGDDFSHTQQSKGSATNGEYRVRLPDGRMQIVSYTADENGYKADVRYDDDHQANNAYEDATKRDYALNNNQRAKPNSYEYDDKQQGNSVFQEYQKENSERDKYYKAEDYNYRSYKVDESSQEGGSDNEAVTDYYNDYDYNEPHNSRHESKFSHLAHKDKKIGVIVVPDKNKPLAFEANGLPDAFIYKQIPVEINVPSTTPSHPVESTTERVVLIGGSKNVNEDYANSLSTLTYQPSPSSYLASTIAGLRKNIDFSGPIPTFSSSFIDRINRYLKS